MYVLEDSLGVDTGYLAKATFPTILTGLLGYFAGFYCQDLKLCMTVSVFLQFKLSHFWP